MNISEFFKAGAIISCASGKVMIAYGARNSFDKPQNDKGPNFYFPDFFLQEKTPWYCYQYYAELSLTELKELIPLEIQENSLPWDSPDKDAYESAFYEILNEGALRKAVPYVFQNAQGTLKAKQLAVSLYSLLEIAEHYPFHLYGFWNEQGGILGITPEVLFHLEEHSIKTVALAGTASRENSSGLLTDPKIQLEHELVIEGLFQDLNPYGSVTKGLTEVISLPRLCHLKTPVLCQLYQPVCALALIRALHPTPALGGFPRQAAENWLQRYQCLIPRDRFGAPVGISIEGITTCYVAIRNVQWTEKLMKIGAGGGVVKQSHLEDEWAELLLKLQATRELLKL